MTSARLPRVLIVGQGAPVRGGIPTFVTRLAEDPLLAQRADVEFFNTSPKEEKSPAALTLSNIRLSVTHAVEVFRRARRSDVVHLNLAPVPLLPLIRAITLAAAARLGGARVVLHAHTGRMQSGVDRRVYRALLRSSRALVDVFVVVSEAGRAAAQAAGVDALLIQNGVDVNGFETGPKAGEPPTIVFVGTVCERKGLLDLRDALVSLRSGTRLPARVLIIGDGKQEGPDAFEWIRAGFDAADLQEVQFLGAIEPELVRRILATASIFCLPSHWEGAPLSVLEAMAAGTALVATRVGEIPAMLDEGRAGILVDVRDVDGLERALRRLLRDEAERDRLGLEARRRVEQLYTWDATVQRVSKLYSNLAAGSRRARSISPSAPFPPGA